MAPAIETRGASFSIFAWIKYPFVLGEDVAGEVVEVGAGVTRFAVGDRVLGYAVGSGLFHKDMLALEYSTVIHDIIAALRGKNTAGALAIGKESAGPCSDILKAGSGNKFIAITSSAVSFETVPEHPGANLRLAGLVARMVSSTMAMMITARMRGIGAKSIYGSSLKSNEVSKVIFEDFLPQALADGHYVTAPAPRVIGTGLEFVQPGFDLQKKRRLRGEDCRLSEPPALALFMYDRGAHLG